jgi:hypothetical protein
VAGAALIAATAMTGPGIARASTSKAGLVAQPACISPHCVSGQYPPGPDPGPGWQYVYMQAFTGGGCLTVNFPQRLAPLTDEPCKFGSLVDDWMTTYFWERQIIVNGKEAVQLLFTDGATFWDVGFSGGQFKLETASDSWYLYQGATFGVYALYQSGNSANYMSESAKGTPLNTPTKPANPDDMWTIQNACSNPLNCELH